MGFNSCRILLFLVPALLHAQTNAKQQAPAVRPPLSAKVVHQSAIVVDTHADTPQRFLDEGFDVGSVTSMQDGHFDLDKAREANLAAEFFSIWVDPKFKGSYAHRALDLIDSVHQQADMHPRRILMTFSEEGILLAHRQHMLAALMGVEGGHAIENDIRVLRDFYRLGARYMTLTWSNTNEWADSSGDIDDKNVTHHNGLTEFGKEVVREMNRLGMMVDVSHVSDKTFYDALLITRAPVLASHSSARALTNHPRNMTDDMVRAVARNGGVVMVNFFSGFVDADYLRAYEAQKPERDRAKAELEEKLKDASVREAFIARERLEKEWAAKIPRPPLKSLIDHIDHIAKVAGVDHVGLGSDFDGVPSLPEGIDSVADLPKITAALLERGYNAREVRKILGGNLLRVFLQVETVSRAMRREKPTAASPSK